MLCRRSVLVMIVAVWAVCQGTAVSQSSGLQDPEKSVVLIRSIQQDFDHVTPWKRGELSRIIGSGFVIAGKRILTNAHNVSNYRYVELKKEGVAKRYPAKVLFVGHDCDLALVGVDDESFFEGAVPLEPAGIPQVNTAVYTYGFPVGGDRISVTKGVVSRVEADTYAHSGADQHLVIQTDAAINPGNSGGPVAQDGRVVGVAFQGLREAENIGYLIPTTVISHFLADTQDGKYDGFGTLGVRLYPGLHNPSYKEFLKIPPREDGVVVIGTMMHSSAESILQPNDVLTSIDDYNIDNDGMVGIYGLKLHFSEIVETKQIGETVELTFYRNGQAMKKVATVGLNHPILDQARQHDRPPRYVCFAGLVFVPATRNFLETWGRRWPRDIPFDLRYLLRHSNELNEDRDRTEYVVLSQIMPDEVNTYAGDFKNRVVQNVNDLAVHSLQDVQKAFRQPVEKFHTIRFLGDKRLQVIDAPKARIRQQAILAKYQIPAEARLE